MADRLFKAVYACDHAQVRACIDAGDPVNAVDPEGATALHWAAGKACSDRAAPAVIALLIEAGANVEARDNDGLTALDRLCTNMAEEHGFVRGNAMQEALSLLVPAQQALPRFRLGAAAQTSKAVFSTLFIRYPGSSTRYLWEQLLDAGMDPNIQDECYNTPLHHLARLDETRGNILYVFNKFLGAGAKTDLCNSQGKTPIIIAAENRNSQMVRALISQDSTPPGAGLTDVFLSPMPKSFSLWAPGADALKNWLKPLVEGGLMDAERVWKELYRWYTLAPTGGPVSMARRTLLETWLDAGGSPARTDETGNTLLHVAVFNGLSRAETRHLLQQGFDPNATNRHGQTPLHLACTSETHAGRMLPELVNAGARADLLDTKGRSPLHVALDSFSTSEACVDIEVVRLLLEAGGDPNQPDQSGLAPAMVVPVALRTELFGDDYLGPRQAQTAVPASA